jgi:hypothetical protein
MRLFTRFWSGQLWTVLLIEFMISCWLWDEGIQLLVSGISSYNTIYYIINFVSAFLGRFSDLWLCVNNMSVPVWCCFILGTTSDIHIVFLCYTLNLYHQPYIVTSNTCSGFPLVVITFIYFLYCLLFKFHKNTCSTLNMTKPCILCCLTWLPISRISYNDYACCFCLFQGDWGEGFIVPRTNMTRLKYRYLYETRRNERRTNISGA